MRKILRTLFVLTLLFLSFQSKAQITIGTVDAGPYTPGSSIAATFSLGSTCVPIGNRFELYLSDATGNFVSNTPIGNYAGFYSTYVNGIIPGGTPAGTGYKLRIRSTSLGIFSTESLPFTIITGNSTEARLTSPAPISTSPEITFGSCNTDENTPNTPFRFTNASTAANVTVTITNELNSGPPTVMTFTSINEIQTYTATLAHFTMFVKAVMPDGRVSTKAYFLINNLAVTAFTTTSGNTVCFPTGAFEYRVDVNSNDGIKINFPGNTYHIDWGDNTFNDYTYCDILTNSSKVGHTFTRSSCGLSYTSGTQTVYNAFGVNVGVMSPFCGAIGSPLSTPARVVSRPENRFTFPPIACLGDNVVFTNLSLPGQKASTNSPGCADNNVLYSWYVDGVLIAQDKPLNFNFERVFTTKGQHLIMLTSSSDGGCQADNIELPICIQDPPKPSFTIPTNLLCLTSGTLTATSTSILDNTCPNTPTYLWAVTNETGAPASGVTYIGGTNANSINPQFRFNQLGIYNITLTISSATCQVTTIPQRIVVNTDPLVSLSPDIALCARGEYTFDPNASVTKTTTSGTADVLANTYTWTVTGGQFDFVAPTNANSRYPKINFKDFATYTVTLTHTNNCNTATDVQQITFSPAPIPVITATPSTVCYNDNINLTGRIDNNNPNTTFQWVGSGTFTPVNNLTTIYTPTNAERVAGVANIKLVVQTGLVGTCSQVETLSSITIFPENTTTNPVASRSQNICTGNQVAFLPTSTVSGSIFTWTATNADGNASGIRTVGSGKIEETIVNTNPTANAVVVYTITPKANGCDGVPFTFTVTVTPRPVVTVNLAAPTICSGTGAGITMSSNLPAPPSTSYIWTSVVTTGTIEGNTNNAQSTTTGVINDILINTSKEQATVIYTITPISAAGCPGTPVDITILVDPAVTTAKAGNDESICDQDNFTLQGNAPEIPNETGTWTLTSGQVDITIVNPNLPNTAITGLRAGQFYTFKWTISAPTTCLPSSDEVVITVNEPTVAGIISSDATICIGTSGSPITLAGQIGSIIKWESSIDGGLTWEAIANTTTSLTYPNLTITTQYRAVVQNGSCQSKETNIVTITVTPTDTRADAGTDQQLCNQLSVTLAANASTPLKPGESGLWTLVPANPTNPTINIVNPTSPTTEVTGLVIGQTYTFKWTITGPSACGPTEDNVVIVNLPPITGNTASSTSANVCSGQTVLLNGSQPTGGTGSYIYLWEISTDNGNTWDVVSDGAGKDLTFLITVTTKFRRTVNSGACPSISNEYQIIAEPPIDNNIISADQTFCTGLTPALLTGTTPTGGGGNFNYKWQSSIDGGTTWTDITTAVGPTYQPVALTVTTLYRRIVSTITCNGDQKNISDPVTITVKPNAKAEFTWTKDKDCTPFVINSNIISVREYPDRNATYTWFADALQIGTGPTFPGYTINSSNESVTIKLIVTPSTGCQNDEMSHVFSTNQSAAASYTQSATEGCGPLLINFVNTSASLADATFRWDFGNGSTSSSAQPSAITFQPEATGRDTIYTVTLTAITSCGTSSVTSTVFVKAKPVAVFSPSKTDGCSPMLVNFTNTSPGSTNRYFYDFGDGTPILEKTDKSPVSHTYNTTTTQTFRATLTVVNECGTDVRGYNIRVAPQNITPELVVDANEKEGCAPLLVNFDNNSIGATRFTFDFGDGGTANTVSPGRVQHTFTRPGTYTVTMTAYNSCSEIATTETITVLPQPVADFNADITLGCAGLAVQFRNTTQDGFSYRWDFGDGTTSDEFEPIHTYDGEQEYYTVTLTATNTLGCSIAVIKNQYIHIVLPPVARFNVNPSTVISIPNYTFRFEDESTNNPTIWAWDFGDGTTSSLQNPSHTYADTGSYVVRLRVANQQGCSTNTFKTVQIVGVPGYLFVPNSFMPGGENPELREFKAKGSGIKTWKMSVFNKWGQTLWETTELNEGRPAKGWDGTFQGTVQPQGVFFWKIDIEFINGTEWKGMTYDSSAPKKTGVIHLIR
ncbi:PKD domain-containing protein [Pedobacter sp. MR2016-24]|uniref:PKD domain-containing protein n=1 Tax=Pedobacter sp. MR2016-24 TaxID=2994466 RepID=UPI002245E005|nr:PKD domain-containing protein [Pedobacter sp. MR2016-24]MCX2482214.1 PKD domain-containing protein [Pedobacter sp. MR2016-24]